MARRLQSHPLRHLRRQRRAQSTCAKKHEPLARAENVLVIGALGVNPEFQHPARSMERAGNVAVALEFANIADVHQDQAWIVLEFDRLLRGYGLDLLFGLGTQFLNRFLELQGHNASPPLFLSLALTASATRDG